MKKINLVLLLALFSANAIGQTNTYLRLYANMGVQMNSNNVFNTNLNSNFLPFQLGAGSNYKFGGFLVGTEFYNSNGNIKNNQYKIDYKEFTSTLYVGYDLLSSSDFAIEPNIGFFMKTGQSITHELQNNNTQAYNIGQLGISTSLTLTRFNHSGLSTAIKIGCNIPLGSEQAWKNGTDDSHTNFSSNQITPFVQLNIGGRIKLKKKRHHKSDFSLSKPTLEPQSEEHKVRNQETLLYTIVYPKQNAETILLLHGGPGVPNRMKEVTNLLKQKYQVIYFDQRGTGLSNCPNGSYAMEDYISDINAIAAYYELDTFHIFGHSWGGLYAQIYADKNLSKINSLFLCSPSSGTNTTWKETEKEVMLYNKENTSNSKWLKMGVNSMFGALGSNKSYRKLFKQVLKNYHHNFQQIEISDEELAGIHAEPINKTRREIINYKPLTKIENPAYPICITYGDDDIYGKSKGEVIDRFPTAKVYDIKNCGHMPWMHNKVEFEKIVTNFYKLKKGD
ncbi:alpha/beta fold hydrolase [Flammeovirga aprica]|uniref:Alpha/beta hydrolase n=1 Tax=Flammeovirga aprica JL-4 TaxID=694437 RepID=A0A7X9XBQ2_9BACT|nr:alpha/beta hydrolase [Flammeovirga aprica]NME70975.1 alpha/beta hydrolase [Flammeovirga aprica JL-4]